MRAEMHLGRRQIAGLVWLAACHGVEEPSEGSRAGMPTSTTEECALSVRPAVVDGALDGASTACAVLTEGMQVRLSGLTGPSIDEVMTGLDTVIEAGASAGALAVDDRRLAYVDHEGAALLLATGSGLTDEGSVACAHGVPWFQGGEGATSTCYLASADVDLSEEDRLELEGCREGASDEDLPWVDALASVQPPGHLLAWVSGSDAALLEALGHGPAGEAPFCGAGQALYSDAFQDYGSHEGEALFAMGLSGRGLNGAHFEGADLAAADLSFADLSYAYVSDAKLVGADLSSADLTSAVLSGTDLTGSIWRSADARGVDLTGADLSQADLSEANLEDATLAGVLSGGVFGTPAALPEAWQLLGGYLMGPGVDLSGRDLSGMDLTGVNLTDADLSGADLTGVIMDGAMLTRGDLSGADLSGAFLSGAELGSANLTGARLTGADLTGVDLSTAILTRLVSGDLPVEPGSLPELWRYTSGYLVGPDADLVGADLRGANLNEAYLTGADLTGADLTGAALVAANLYAAILEDAVFDRVLLSMAYMSSVQAAGARFTDSDISNADLTYADMAGADFSGSVLSFSVASYGDFTGADLSYCELFAVYFTGTDMTDADFTFADGVNATYWLNTTCPDGTNSDDNLGTCCGHLNDVLMLTAC